MAASTTIVSEDCALFFGNRGPLIASGDGIGLKQKIKARLVARKAPDSDPWVGITLDFPLGKDQEDNEKSGFGVRYRAPEHASETSKPSGYHQIRLKFPRGFKFALENGEARSKFTNEHLCYIKIIFGEAKPTVEGFGLPFANRKDPQVEAWVNKNAPMAGEYTLMDILKQENFRALYWLLLLFESPAVDQVERPTVQTINEKEPGSENYYNRFVKDSQVSALEFLQASGLPIFRLRTQVRTTEGMYDLAREVFYPDLPIKYRKRLTLETQQLDIGRELETYARMKYPELRKPPEGILQQPFFVHRPSSTIFKDVDGTQACQEQDSYALTFLVGLITNSAIDPAQIVILTPWLANATLIERKRGQKNYRLLKNIQETTTIENFQGKEADIVVIVMSTTRETGPEITANEQLLRKMLTRHKSGLVIFGDICASGVIGGDNKGNLFKINKKAHELTALQKIDEKLFDDGRITTMKKGGRGPKSSNSS
ncbi:putative ATP-dependent helicase C29A10.10c [Fusarium austroafricanum]|uniref:Putative ATP-dependent helicase C29A10.10c n=1 Tax=Fusarium austroafricanum TaxID=2364996 RepID=A0A8H4K872_9HYPO|nr:putative ATP-dependent helicase C29A10.10c [Fusarium austroafricanum]